MDVFKVKTKLKLKAVRWSMSAEQGNQVQKQWDSYYLYTHVFYNYAQQLHNNVH